MPECAGEDGGVLCDHLSAFAFLFISEFAGIVDILVNVALEGHLGAHVPAVSLHLEGRVEVEPFQIGHFNFAEIVGDRVILIYYIFCWIVCDPRGFHAHESEAPRGYVFQLNVGDAEDHVEQLVEVAVFVELRPGHPVDVVVCSCEINQ